MPITSPHPHVAWRGGRPRFAPGPEMRAKGHTSKDLRHPDGRWYSKGEAVDWARAFAASLPAEDPKPRGRPAKAAARGITVGKMVEKWQESAKWQPGRKQLAENTRRDYLQKLRVIELDFWEVWTSPAAAVKPYHLQNAYDEIERTRGLATARGALIVLGCAFKWAITRGVVRDIVNPCTGLEKSMPDPRVRFGTRTEIATLIATADTMGMPYVADAIVLGLWTAQRQGDRLALVAHGLLKNRRVFRQAKTGAIVHILSAPEPRCEARGRRRAPQGHGDRQSPA